MTLKEFQHEFPNTFRNFKNSKWVEYRDKSILDRIYFFIDSYYPRIKINFIPDLNSNNWKPILMIEGDNVCLGVQKTEIQAKKSAISKAICYLEHGFTD